MKTEKKRGSFSSQIGFVLAAAGSAVGLGNIWRFPYLAAKDGGGLFLLVYAILVVTFGYTLLTSEIGIGRMTRQGPLTAYKKLDSKWGFLGILAWFVPMIILPYYCVIGGWVLKYLEVFLTGQSVAAADSEYFGGFISTVGEPIIFFAIFIVVTALVILMGVDKGIERVSSVLMPILVIMILGISLFSLTLKHTDATGLTRTGLEGFKIYLIPNFDGLTLKGLFSIIVDAMGQLFYSISVAMGIMITYGSYAKKETNLTKSINQIELFDTGVAFLAGAMIIPAVFCFTGTEGMAAGPGLIFVALPKVFLAMGTAGKVLGLVFFLIVTVAALTSAVSLFEAILSSLMDHFHLSRGIGSTIVFAWTMLVGVTVCLGYNIWTLDLHFPNGSTGSILDLLDYASNYVLMPIVAMLTCVFVGWKLKPKTLLNEITNEGTIKHRRSKLYVAMVKFIAPAMLLTLLLQSFGIIQ